MHIPANPSLQPLSPPPATAIRPAAWAVGQLLRATVGGSAEAGAPGPGTTVLRIGGQEYIARGAVDLPAGTPVTLKVLASGRLPRLQVLTPVDARAEIITAATRQALPLQGDLLPLLSSALGAGARTGPRPAATGSPLLQSLLAAVPDLSSLGNGPALQRALAASGIFLEARLAELVQRSPGEAPGPDLKAALLKLLAHTQTAATEFPRPAPAGGGSPAAEDPARLLQRQAEAGLARIQLDQLAAIGPQQTRNPVWALDLPIRDGDQAFIARLRIEGEPGHRHATASQGKHWNIALEFDLPGLGPVHARLRLHGSRLDARLWAERPETLELMREYSSILGQRLAAQGFANAAIALYPGRPEAPREQAGFSDLIDVQA